MPDELLTGRDIEVLRQLRGPRPFLSERQIVRCSPQTLNFITVRQSLARLRAEGCVSSIVHTLPPQFYITQRGVELLDGVGGGKVAENG